MVWEGRSREAPPYPDHCVNTAFNNPVNCRDSAFWPGSGILPRYTVPNRRPLRS